MSRRNVKGQVVRQLKAHRAGVAGSGGEVVGVEGLGIVTYRRTPLEETARLLRRGGEGKRGSSHK